jgi:glycosyltransferase involved in cell wall biosynthesis
MRILYVIPGDVVDTAAGGMVFAHNEIAMIAREGIETKILYTGTGTNIRRFPDTVYHIRQSIEEYNPDLVHSQFGSLTALACACSVSIPLIITYRGSDLNPSPYDGRFRSAAQTLCSQLAAIRAKHIICVSSQLSSRLWWRRSIAKVIPGGVDLSVFQYSSKEEARTKLGWPHDEKIVLFNAGRSPAVKRLDLAKAAFEVIRDQIGQVRFVVMRGEVHHDEIPLYLSGSDCLLFTSDYEGSPYIIKEALACNLPVVGVAAGDVPERLEHVSPSRLVGRDAREIGMAAVDIIKAGQRSNGHETLQALSIENTVNRILSIYKQAINSHRTLSKSEANREAFK